MRGFFSWPEPASPLLVAELEWMSMTGPPYRDASCGDDTLPLGSTFDLVSLVIVFTALGFIVLLLRPRPANR